MNFLFALLGATRGLLLFRYLDSDTPQTVAAIDRAQDRLLAALARLNECHALDGWRCVRGVKVDTGGD